MRPVSSVFTDIGADATPLPNRLLAANADMSRFGNELLGKPVTVYNVGGIQLAFVSLPLTSAGTHRMDEQRKSCNNGHALDEESIRD